MPDLFISEMTSQQRRPAMVSESEMDGCMKGVVMLIICAFYAILLFVTAAVCSLVYRGIKSGCKYNIVI